MRRVRRPSGEKIGFAGKESFGKIRATGINGWSHILFRMSIVATD